MKPEKLGRTLTRQAFFAYFQFSQENIGLQTQPFERLKLVHQDLTSTDERKWILSLSSVYLARRIVENPKCHRESMDEESVYRNWQTRLTMHRTFFFNPISRSAASKLQLISSLAESDALSVRISYFRPFCWQ